MNIALDYALIFGQFGFHAYGIAGLGYATTVSYTLLAIVLFSYLTMKPKYRQYWQAFKSWQAPTYLYELLKVGLPMGLMYCFEAAYNFALAIMMGRNSVDAFAANELVMQYLIFFSTISFAIAQALTVRMGHELGGGRQMSANRAISVGVLLALVICFVLACLQWLMPHAFIALDFTSKVSKHPLMVQMSIIMLGIAAIFLILEAVRITLFGALRAYEDTRFALVSSVIAFWFIALPLGYALSLIDGIGVYGYWWALTLSAGVNIALLFSRLYKRYLIV